MKGASTSKYTRRAFLKKAGKSTVAATTAIAGYVGTKNFFDGYLFDQLYGTAHDMYTEFSGIVERQLKQRADDLRTYIGREKEDIEKRAAYWERVHFLGKEDFRDLEEIASKIDIYSDESNLLERVNRWFDRVEKRRLDWEEKYDPDALEGAREGWRNLFGREAKPSSRPGFKSKYHQRVSMLVEVYDRNRDNKMAQGTLLKDMKGYFEDAHKEVMSNIDDFLKAEIKDKDERQFVLYLKELGEKDPSGRMLADFVFNTKEYFTALGMTEEMLALNKQAVKTKDNLKKLQHSLDEGIKLKERLRETDNQYLDTLRLEVDKISATMADLKKVLDEGRSVPINYEPLQKFAALRDKLYSVGRGMREGLGIGIGTSLGVGAYLLSGLVLGSDKKIYRREALGLRTENKELRKEIERLKSTKEGK